jgi:hypothetical protein
VKLIPPVPPAVDGRLAVSDRRILAALVHGITSGCVVCGGSTVQYWPHENRFHPLHSGCVVRLVDHWRTMLDAAEDGADAPVRAMVPAGLTGAYARRVHRGSLTVVTERCAVAPAISPEVRANRFWRPGMPSNAPWVVVVETTAARRHTHCGTDEAHGRRVLALAELGARSAGSGGRFGVVTVGGVLVTPGGIVEASWGRWSDPFGEPLYRSLTQITTWTRCHSCDVWCWPGRWLVADRMVCATCAKPGDGGRPWPEEASAPGGVTEPPVAPKKKGRKKDSVPLD